MKLRVLSILLFAIGIFSCEREDPQDNEISLNQEVVEINFGSEFQLDATFNRTGYTAQNFVWESANSEVASVNNFGLVTANRVGTTQVTVRTDDGQFTKSSEVTVIATNNLYREPFLEFNSSRNAIKAFETRTLEGEDDVVIAYSGENSSVRNVVYVLENEIFVSVGVLLRTTEAIAEQALNFLDQRYQYEGDEEGFFFYSKDDILIGITIDEELGLYVLYLGNTDFVEGRVDMKDYFISESEKLKIKSKAKKG